MTDKFYFKEKDEIILANKIYKKHVKKQCTSKKNFGKKRKLAISFLKDARQEILVTTSARRNSIA